MSLFDIIKYPITVDFKQEDLERIPASILIKWWKNAYELEELRSLHSYTSDNIIDPGANNNGRASNISYVLYALMVSGNQSGIDFTSILKSLKKYIEEYEPT